MRLLLICLLISSYSFSQRQKPENYKRFDEKLLHFGFMLGGNSSDFTMLRELNVFEKYNPRKDKWMPLPKLPFNVSAHSVIVKNDELYVFGDYKHMNLAHKFDFDLNQWQAINGFNASRHNAAAMLNDAIYVIGGNLGPKGPFLKDIQIFR